MYILKALVYFPRLSSKRNIKSVFPSARRLLFDRQEGTKGLLKRKYSLANYFLRVCYLHNTVMGAGICWRLRPPKLVSLYPSLSNYGRFGKMSSFVDELINTTHHGVTLMMAEGTCRRRVWHPGTDADITVWEASPTPSFLCSQTLCT